MTLEQYIAKHQSAKKIPADILQRWNERIVPRGLHQLGEAGARQYLADYGRGIGPEKLVKLARCAEAHGAPDVARGFWKRAYELDPAASEESPDTPAAETPSATTRPTPAAPSTPLAPTPAPAGNETALAYTVFPPPLRPGALVTMQPVDAPHDQDYYIQNPDYWGQPKRDGQRLVLFAAPDRCYYQHRSTLLTDAPSLEIDAALRAAAGVFGPFILDAEHYYLSATGTEHRTGAQAATANGKNGHAAAQPSPKIALFKALFAAGQDLTGEPESERIAQAEILGAWLAAAAPDHFEVLPTARTAEEKAALVGRQLAEGREGEVWVRRDCRYRGGKDEKSGDFVRTKYIRTLDVVVTNLTPSKKKGRPFGAIEVGVMKNGDGPVSIGSVGTGFTQAEMEEIARLHRETPGQVVITIGTQGFTETGQVWHGRFIEIRRDKPAAECVLEGARGSAPAAHQAGAVETQTASAQLALF